jgi:hypothetical protein
MICHLNQQQYSFDHQEYLHNHQNFKHCQQEVYMVNKVESI